GIRDFHVTGVQTCALPISMKTLRTLVQARGKGRDAQYKATSDALKALLDRVASLDEDRILRSFMGVIGATLRTGYYQVNEDGSQIGRASCRDREEVEMDGG